MRRAWPTLMSDLLSVFMSSDAFISKSESESNGPFLPMTARFWMTSTSMGSKLSRDQMEHIQSRVVSMCRSNGRTSSDDDLLRPAGRANAMSWEKLDMAAEAEETRSVSSTRSGAMTQKTPSKLNPSGVPSFEGV